MFRVQPSKEQEEKIKAKREERAKLAAERTTQAEAAYLTLLEKVDYDETRLIVYPMPEAIGGAVIHFVPTPEAWAITSKRITKGLLSDGKKEDVALSIAGLVQDTRLLAYPPLPELQKWRDELPDLFSEVHNGMDARCSHGVTGGK